MDKQTCRKLAEIIKNEDVLDMLKNAKNCIKDWTVASRLNPAMSKGYAYKAYPKLLKRLIKSVQTWMDAPHPRSTPPKKFGNAYNLVFHNLFCKTYAEYQSLIGGGMFPETSIDAKKFLEDYFKIDLTI